MKNSVPEAMLVAPVQVIGPLRPIVRVPAPVFTSRPGPESAPVAVPAPLTVRVPELAMAELRLIVPGEISSSPLPVPELVTAAFRVIAPAALRVRVVSALQDRALERVMLPAWVPDDPVETVTLAPARAFCREVTLITAESPVAVNPLWLASAPVEMVTL